MNLYAHKAAINARLDPLVDRLAHAGLLAAAGTWSCFPEATRRRNGEIGVFRSASEPMKSPGALTARLEVTVRALRGSRPAARSPIR